MKIKLGLSNSLNVGKLGVMGGGAAAAFTISGTVYDADGSTAVASATVALGAYSATSQANGTYTITGVPEGASGSMTCTKTGYRWTAKTISAMSGNLTSQNYSNAWWAAGGCAEICTAAYQAKGAASFAASKINLANPGTYDAADGTNAPSWSAARGWIAPDRSKVYSLTSTQNTATGMSLIAYFANADTAEALTQAMVGRQGQLHVAACYSDYIRAGYGGTSAALVTEMATGSVAVCAGKTYVNGVYNQTLTGSTFGNAINPFGNPVDGRLGVFDVTAEAIYSAELSAAQVLAVHNAMAALP